MVVKAFLVEGGRRWVWQKDTHLSVASNYWRRKRNVGHDQVHNVHDVQDRIRITLEGIEDKVVNLNVGLRRHPVNANTIVEWVSESGERTITNGVQGVESCWYSGWVEDESDSSVTLGICQGNYYLIPPLNRSECSIFQF